MRKDNKDTDNGNKQRYCKLCKYTVIVQDHRFILFWRDLCLQNALYKKGFRCMAKQLTVIQPA